MGFDKFELPFGERTFLQCVFEKLRDSVEGPIVAAASETTLERVRRIADAIDDSRLEVVVDELADSGPVEGIRCGLVALAGRARWGFVTGCDVPMLRSQVVDLLVDAAKDSRRQAVLPHRGARIYGITALYRTDIGTTIEAMIGRNELRVSDLAKYLDCRMIDVEQLREVDPQFDSIQNVNSPGQYLEYLRAHGLDCPQSILDQLAKSE